MTALPMWDFFPIHRVFHLKFTVIAPHPRICVNRPSGEPGGCVAEETEQDTGADASSAGVDPAVVALVLGGASETIDGLHEEVDVSEIGRGRL